MLKKFWASIALALFALVLMSPPSFAADTKIGYIDMQKAIQETSAGKKAKSELEAEFKKKKAVLEKLETDIKKKGEDFEKRSMAMNEAARAKKQQELQGDMRNYQELATKSQMEIQKRERELTQPIVKKLRTIIDELAEKQSFTMILEKSENSVMWAKKDLDLTEEVIKEFNKRK